MSTKAITWDKSIRKNILIPTTSRPAGTISPTFRYPLADNPTLTVVGLLVTFPPNASVAPHRHGTASVIGYVMEGSILSGMNNGEPAVYKAGGSWYEAPGCFHRISDNASRTEKAVLHATFVIKTEILEKEGMGVLVQYEPEYLEGAMEQMQRDAK
ncbi:MAG: hypothetical protein M1830_004500 [Pleopsidium flavum]|nr:MAG: hypothetical protein M1830_004500 [Pleopsidium flavum]